MNVFNFVSRLFAFLLLMGLFITCKKSKSADEVKYEVTLVNAPSWDGSYFNENGQVVSVTAGSSGWQYTFKNSNGLSTAVLAAYPNGTNPSADATLKIYINGTVVASSRASVSPQVQYIFPQ